MKYNWQKKYLRHFHFFTDKKEPLVPSSKKDIKFFDTDKQEHFTLVWLNGTFAVAIDKDGNRHLTNEGHWIQWCIEKQKRAERATA